MCGIIGAVATRNVTHTLIVSLKKLEYRGYDSAGMIVIDKKNHFARRRIVGKVNILEQSIKQKSLFGNIGLAHTRWATHGKPSKKNAHPHVAGDIAVVHNGIIENDQEIRKKLVKSGCKIISDTDTELIAHLVDQEIIKGKNIINAIKSIYSSCKGSFAIGLLYRKEPQHLFAMRRGSPLIIGLGKNRNYIASDQLALLSVTQKFIILADGDIADITDSSITIYDANGNRVERPIVEKKMSNNEIKKGHYKHFMLKEIMEQPEAVLSTLDGRITQKKVLVGAFGKKAEKIFSKIRRVHIVGCGTSYHAGLVARYWIEQIAKLPCQVDIASEYRYRHKLIEANTLFVAISQSGETADTLSALVQAKSLGFKATLAICNVAESAMARESDLVFLTNAGPEIGVASTKAFTTQLVALFLLAISLGRYRHLTTLAEAQLIKCIRTLPKKIQQILSLNASIKSYARRLVTKHNMLFLGRGILVPIAMEGALKLKEIAYIFTEAYPAGELKHGSIALIDDRLSVIMLAPTDHLIEKIKANLEEIKARQGNLIIFTDTKSAIAGHAKTVIFKIPLIDRYLIPIVYVIPLQLLAYHVAFFKGENIDQPRNLAKSVTVE